MKNGTEIYLIGLVCLVVAVFGWSIFSSQQVDLAAAQVGATVASGQLPMAAVISGQVTGWALSSILGMVAVAVGSVAVAYARKMWKGRNGKRAWRNGPNAQWQQERQPRPVSDAEMLKTMVYQQMLANNPGKRQTAQQVPVDDELDIRF